MISRTGIHPKMFVRSTECGWMPSLLKVTDMDARLAGMHSNLDPGPESVNLCELAVGVPGLSGHA